MNRLLLQKLIDKEWSQQQISDYFKKPKTTVVYWLNKYELKTKPNSKSIIWNIDKTELEKIAKESESIAHILRQLGYDKHLTSNLYKSIKRRLKRDQISIDHIKLGLKNRKGKGATKYVKDTFLEVLKTREFLNYNDKKRLAKFDIIPNKNCAICGQGRIWNGKKLTLQIDHIDGNPKNQTLKNLRFICPNCHTQTKTFCKSNFNGGII